MLERITESIWAHILLKKITDSQKLRSQQTKMMFSKASLEVAKRLVHICNLSLLTAYFQTKCKQSKPFILTANTAA